MNCTHTQGWFWPTHYQPIEQIGQVHSIVTFVTIHALQVGMFDT